jgi:hypothetical protein
MIIIDFLMSNICLYILYRSNPQKRLDSTIWLLLAVSFASSTVAHLLGQAPTPNVEHYAVALGVVVKFISLFLPKPIAKRI